MMIDNHSFSGFNNKKSDHVDLLSSTLNSFRPISLREMGSVKLMDRVDKKYIFHLHRLPVFLNWLKEAYRVLTISEHRSITYESIYFDTPHFDLYRQHHRGKMTRYKVRYRNYAENNVSFFEIKLKTNKGRTVKSRISCQEIEESINGSAKQFLERKTHLLAENLRATLWIKYKRITLVNLSSAERVTLDTGISFKNKAGAEHFFPFVVAEVKQEKSRSSEFAKMMKNNSIREGFMSKYCLGLSCLVPLLKKNNFKRSLAKLHKLQPHVSIHVE